MKIRFEAQKRLKDFSNSLYCYLHKINILKAKKAKNIFRVKKCEFSPLMLIPGYKPGSCVQCDKWFPIQCEYVDIYIVILRYLSILMNMINVVISVRPVDHNSYRAMCDNIHRWQAFGIYFK